MKERKGYRTAVSMIGKGAAIGCVTIALLTAFSMAGSSVLAQRGSVTPQIVTEDISVDPTLSSEGFSAVLYDNTNGLPTSEANSIVETEEGFIWIGSYSGLIRYDGNSFERMDSTTGIASVVSLYVDSRDRLWIGTNDSGVAVMEQGEYTRFGKPDGLPSSSIRGFAEDPSGNVYVATTQGLVMINSDMTVMPVLSRQLQDVYIRDIRPGPDGRIYGVTIEGDVFIVSDSTVIGFYDGARIGNGAIISVLPDPEAPGCVYLGTKTSEIYYRDLNDPDSETTVIDVSPMVYVNSMEKIGEELWFCADNGIAKVNRIGVTIPLTGVPMNTTVEQMITDYQGNMWFASGRQGVMKIVPNQFTDIFELNRLSDAVVNSTCYYDDKLFIGEDSGLVVVGEYGRVGSVPLESAVTASGVDLNEDELLDLLSDTRIRSIIKDSSDRLWFSCYNENALVRYDHGNVMVFRMEDGLPSDRVRAVYERSDGTIMVACTGGLVLIDGDRIVEVYDETSGISNIEILTVCEAPNGDMLVGTDGDGIYVIHDASVMHIGAANGLTSEVVMRIKRDLVRDILWIVTSNSLGYMDSDLNVTTIEQFPYSNNFDLYENSQGEMWILSSNGIYVTTAEDLLANGQISTVFYGRDNGLPCIATSNSYSGLSDNGDLYLAGSTGVAKVNIEVPFEDVNDLKVAVPYIEADGVTLYPDADGNFTVGSDVNKVTIYAYVYTYSLMNPQITYYLDGFDGEANNIRRSDLNPIDYTNLRGGDYRFVMQIKDSMGHGYNELSVTIVKQRAFYETLSFKIMCVLAVILVGAVAAYIYGRARTRKLMKKQSETMLLVREMSEAFAKTIDMKDKYTKGHSTRVANYTSMLSEELGYDKETVDKYYYIALLHDIGKIGVPPEVLNKAGKLSDDEFNRIKSHSRLGEHVLKEISIMPELAIGAGSHHERPDGKGYPQGLKGDEIPRVAQIIAVADTFDAMYSDRPYRKRMNFEKAVSIIKEASGTQLTAVVVDAFLRLVEKGIIKPADDDEGGGTFEDIDNIHKRLNKEK